MARRATQSRQAKSGTDGIAASSAQSRRESAAGVPQDPEGADREFYGSATVGERGQIVIPAEARQKLDIKQGDKLLIFSGMRGGRMLSVMKSEQVTEFVATAIARLSRIGEIARKEDK